jgi:hypothetical protein
MHRQHFDGRLARDPDLLDLRHQPVGHEMPLTRMVEIFGMVERGEALKIALIPSA